MGFSSQTAIPAGAFEDLIREIEALRQFVVQRALLGRESLLNVPPDCRQSALNLLHYLALRSEDIRPLQDRLARLGLSSLGRVEPHVLATIDAVLRNLYLLSGQQPSEPCTMEIYEAFDFGSDRLEINTTKLLGDFPRKRRAHILVTMPTQASTDYPLVLQLLKAGMNCIRINCAHDDQPTWSGMIANLRKAERATGRTCRILMDLEGSKLRLGPMKTEPGVIKIKPERGSNGRVLKPARIWLSSVAQADAMGSSTHGNFVVSDEWLAHVKRGDRVRFRDARGSRRCWRISQVSSEGCVAEARKTAYLANGVILNLHRGKGKSRLRTEISNLPLVASVCLIRNGDSLIVSASGKPGRPATLDESGDQLIPGRVSLPVPEVFRDVCKGDPIVFDDGRIGGVIEESGPDQLLVRITHTIKTVEKLEGGRGVNLPATSLHLPAFNKKDMQDMVFAARHADMIGLSFANNVQDVQELYWRMQKLGCHDVGVVLKIETKRGFYNLPAMILEAMKFPAFGVMIARGDLAVECGFERMSELQEEIMWVCESAHVPVIWATQVLESLTRKGQATRAEISDAAMSQSAEAVMLNKGAHVVQAVIVLDDILKRMQGHHRKKRSLLRKLQLAS